MQKFDGVGKIRSDHGTKFDQVYFKTIFFSERGIKHEFSTPKTSQQNGVIERKKQICPGNGRVMLHSKNIM